MREFTALFPFGGSGGGALGFAQARGAAHGLHGRFRILGSLDFDAIACADFEAFTGAPAWCVDMEDVTPEDVRERYGRLAPDVVFMSPPCKGSSSLLSKKKAVSAKYMSMNRLAVVWTRVMLAAWNEPPALVLLENVPGLPARAPGMLAELDHIMSEAGYVSHASDHDCGEIGGLAQRRRRHLRVWRHKRRCASLLFQAPIQRVRGVGEVLSELPMPATTAAAEWGRLHTMPRLSWRNWLRLALIPAGGDWRDLEGVLQGRARREVFRRHAVQAWTEPHPTVTGPGGHSVESVADPRVMLGCTPHPGAYGVLDPDAPSPTIVGAGTVRNRPVSVADPRIAAPPGTAWHTNKFVVTEWEKASQTVIGCNLPSMGAPAVADPRVSLPPGTAWHSGAMGVRPWDEPSGTVTGGSHPSKGVFTIADVRVSQAYDAGYGVLRWEEPARTITGTTAAGCGAYAVADARARALGFGEGVRILTLDEALALDLDPKKAPPFIPVIIAEDGTWHRPMTPLELSMIQSYPKTVHGRPIPWAGTRTQVSEHIGNSVPPKAAEAIAEQMLNTLLTAAADGWSLAGGDTPVWIAPAEWGGLHA